MAHGGRRLEGGSKLGAAGPGHCERVVVDRLETDAAAAAAAGLPRNVEPSSPGTNPRAAAQRRAGPPWADRSRAPWRA